MCTMGMGARDGCFDTPPRYQGHSSHCMCVVSHPSQISLRISSSLFTRLAALIHHGARFQGHHRVLSLYGVDVYDPFLTLSRFELSSLNIYGLFLTFSRSELSRPQICVELYRTCIVFVRGWLL